MAAMPILIVLLFLCQWIAEIDGGTTIRVGGLFAPYTSTGQQDIAQSEHLAAFMMAINEINNHSDGIYDDILPNTVVRYDVETSTSLETATTGFINMQSSFNRKGVNAYVTSLDNDKSLLVGQLAGVANLVRLSSVADSGLFNQHSQYPYTIRTVASESRQGMVIQNMVCQYARKVVVYVSTDDEDIQLLSEFQAASSCEQTLMGTILIPGDQLDLSAFAKDAINYGARYFIVFLPAFQTAALIETGYEVGLFGDNSVIITADRGSENITSYFSPKADLVYLLTGFFTFSYMPNYYINRTAEARAFAKRWRAQPSTRGTVINGDIYCDNTTDSQGHYLYQSIYDNATFCTGLDFSAYDAVGKKLQSFTTLTYDATIMMLLALDLAIRDGYDNPSADLLTDYLVNNVSGIQGVSGPINLFGGVASAGYERRGNRISGTEYVAYNFYPNYDLYSRSFSKYYAAVGYFDADSQTYKSCSSTGYHTSTCISATFRSPTDGSVYNAPPDSPYPIEAVMSYSFKFVFSVLVILLLLEVFALAGIVWWYRDTKLMKASQPSLLICFLVGGFITTLRVMAGGSNKDQAGCVTEVWLGHMAFIIMVGALLVKAYRVHCIVNRRTIRKFTFTSGDAFKMLIGIIVVAGIYLIFLTLFGQPVLRHYRVTVRNQETVWKYCTLVYPQWQTALYFLEGGLLIFGFRTCWEIRNVPDLVNESKQISTAMSGIVLVSVLVLPVVYFLGLPVYTREFVACFGFGFGAMSTLGLVFFPKLVIIYCNRANEGKIHASDIILPGTTTHNAGALRPHKKKRNNHSFALTSTQEDNDTSINYKFSRELLRQKNADERLRIVQEQIYGWQTLLIHEQRHALNISSSSEEDTPTNDLNNNNNNTNRQRRGEDKSRSSGTTGAENNNNNPGGGMGGIIEFVPLEGGGSDKGPVPTAAGGGMGSSNAATDPTVTGTTTTTTTTTTHIRSVMTNSSQQGGGGYASQSHYRSETSKKVEMAADDSFFDQQSQSESLRPGSFNPGRMFEQVSTVDRESFAGGGGGSVARRNQGQSQQQLQQCSSSANIPARELIISVVSEHES